MALPPRFPGMIHAYGAVPLPPMAPIMPFPNPYFMPNPLMAAAAVNSQRMAAPAAPQPKPPEKPPVTTVFVGNITEKCGNELIRSILSECGAVATWKRIQGSNGKFQAFGFCEFESPFGTMRALRILHDYQLAEKKLVVKIDDKTRAMVKEYVAKKRAEKGLPAEVLLADEMPADEENAGEDEQVKQKIQTLIETDAPALLPIEGQEGELDEKAHSPGAEKSRASSRERGRERERERERSERLEERRRERKEEERRSRHRRRSRSRSGSRDGRRSRKRSHSDSDRSTTKRSRHHSSSSRSVSSGSTVSSFSGSSFSNRSASRARKAFRSHSPSRDLESEDSDEQRERRALRKQIREKEAAYAERLRKWEARERRQAKLYEKDEQREKQRKRDTQKEAKKLKHFLEDYDDERNDPKYYKSSSLFQRRRDFEREREADAKDRQREQQEIEELKKQILAENENIENADEEARRRHQEQEDALMRKLRADSGSPNPHRPLGQKPLPVEEEREEEEESEDSESDSDSEASADVQSTSEKAATQKPNAWKAVTSEGSIPGGNSPSISILASPSILSSSVASPAVLRTSGQEGSSGAKSSKLSGVFGFEDNEDDMAYRKGKKLKPFEITEEDRIQAMTPEERKQMIKDLIERIPTAKDELFAFPIHWNYVDKTLVDLRVKPWVSKKITDYIGEEEASLVDFVCEKVISKTDPQKILSDIAMVLDDEAEVFVVKMWRLLIYESEARKLGLSKK